ncbi:MAG: Thioesterase thiol ester dehydrase-isomerase [Lasallia pustulata]|uniref:Thioesterase thiol ester dehydrase-isomerase n=1 Tax=Lasallia pustulata TaxID=136370 RepID=A0A5M8PHF6_9LECA|nr:MAG: Thioesterase thiol ester dehydrase-isomerase [Lasallia pustulata]
MSYSELKKRRRDDYSFHLEYRTRWSDNDMYDHMNNSVYHFLFDSIVNAYLIEQCGLQPPSSRQIGLVVHTHCDYFGSVGFPSVVDLGLRVNKLGQSSVTYEIGVFERGADEVRAVGGLIHVFVDREKNRPAADGMSETIRHGLGLLVHDSSKL